MFTHKSKKRAEEHFVTWNSRAYSGLSLKVPRRYHEEAEKLLDALENPIEFFGNLEIYKEDIPSLQFPGVAEATVNVIKECESHTYSQKCQALRDMLYLKIIHNSVYKYRDDEFYENRENTYINIMKKIDMINGLLKDIE